MRFPLNLIENAIAQTSDTKAVVQQSPEQVNPVAIAVGSGVGLAAIVTVAIKLIEKYGNSALDAKQQESAQKLQEQKQELEQQKQIAEFLIEEARRDSATINEALADANKAIHKLSDIFVNKHLDTTKQYMDLYYELLEQMKISNQEATRKNDLLETIAQNQKNVLKILSMRERS